MTREEAIEFGNMWLEINEDCKDSNTYEFFKMATKSLEQEPCEDAISRQAVMHCIDAYSSMIIRPLELKDYIDKLPPVNPQEPCTDLCKSCDTKGCIFQSGIKREKCDFYTLEKREI